MKLPLNLQPVNEYKSKRTHFTKQFIHPDDSLQRRICSQQKIVHAFTDNGFEDVETELGSFVFPEGTMINAEAANHYIMDLPSWGRAEVSGDGSQVNIYDLQDVSIYVYRNPVVTPNATKPYEVHDGNDDFVEDKDTLKTHGLLPEYSIVRKETTQDAKFQVIDNKLYFILPASLTYPVQVWDDTDTSSVSNDDTRIVSNLPNSNFDNSQLQVDIGNSVPDMVRSIMEWTLSSDPGGGIISDVQVDFDVTNSADSSSGKNVNLQELTATFIESQATWNDRITATAWSTAGGDFSATVVDSIALPGVGTMTLFLMGASATNPLTLDWSDTVDFILKFDNETWGGSRDLILFDDGSGTTPPVMTITFTVPAFTPKIIDY